MNVLKAWNIFKGKKYILLLEECKNKDPLVFIMYPHSEELCNMDVQHLLLECLPIQFSEESYKFQAIILAWG